MKHNLLSLLVVAMLLSSCSQLYNFVQVLEAQSSSVKSEDGRLVYEDENCTIYYALWSEGGKATFAIYNKTDEMLIVDPSKSFFIKNGIAQDYFSGEPIIAIPSHTKRIMSESPLMEELLLDCDLDRYPAEKASISYDETNSPLRFTNFITYHIGNSTQEKVIENKFYIAKVTNYAEPYSRTFVERGKRPCQNMTSDDSENYKDTYPTKVYDMVYTFDRSNRFYFEYHKWSKRKLYKTDGKEYYFNEAYNGYTTAGSNEEAAYKQRLLNPFAKPE